jgi:hypothetical protein
MLTEPARNHILNLSDEGLAEYILSGSEFYQPEAVELAREEFERRQLDPGRIAVIEAATLTRIAARQEVTQAAATRPLDFWDKVYVFTSGPLHFHFLIEWFNHDISGERLRARQSLQYGCLGTLFWAMVIAAAIYLSR